MARFDVPEGWVLKGYRFALDPTSTELRSLESHCGASRFAFNHMLSYIKAVLDQRAAEKTYGVSDLDLTGLQGFSLPSLRKTWNARKYQAAPWWTENSKEAYNTGLGGLARALENWSTSKHGLRSGAPTGFPKFRARHRSVKAVRFTTGTIRVEPDRHSITLPRLGRIHTLESTRKLARRVEAGTARIFSATVSFSSGRWWCAFQTIVKKMRRPKHVGRSAHPVVGVDVGVKDLVVVATPEGIEVCRIAAPKPLAYARSGLELLQRRAARQHGPYDPVTQSRRDPSNRWRRTQRRIAVTHAHVVNIRGDAIHKATTMLAQRHELVVVENLAVQNMARNGGAHKRGLNRAIMDAALGRISRQLKYKTAWYGSELVTAPRFFPSTQQCSRCGSKTKIRLEERTYHCRNGCPPIDRDTNAAINLACLRNITNRGDDTRTGTGSGPAANDRVGKGRGANHKTRPVTILTGLAGGDETSTPQPNQTGTAGSQESTAWNEARHATRSHVYEMCGPRRKEGFR